MSDVHVSATDAQSARAIQAAIDSLREAGGRVVLPEVEVTLDRGLQLHSGVELVGQGHGTVLRKAPGRVYPLAGYHNYGMRDVPLQSTAGLEPGMTVAIRDKVHGGFFETFARITWVEDGWVGLDRGLHSDYHANQEPILVTAFPLIYGEGVERVALRDLTLDGNRAEQEAGILACRGAAVYLYQSHEFEVTGVHEEAFAGEGLGFQMCSHGRIADCRFVGNAGNGYHPGAGSTGVTFERCASEDNGLAGFFFCVRANHVSVRDCTFRGNRVAGVSVGTRDCHNVLERCEMLDNAGPGILFRDQPRPVEAHSVLVRGCRIAGNALSTGAAQVEILGDAHDLAFVGNEFAGAEGLERAGLALAPTAAAIWLEGNAFSVCTPDVLGAEAQFARQRPALEVGREAARAVHYRHLGRA